MQNRDLNLTSKINLTKIKIYHIASPGDNCNEDYIGERAKTLEKTSIQSGHNEVSESDFQIIGNSHRIRRRKFST